jgi:hypothetical protein
MSTAAPDLSAVLTRLEALERTNRRLKRVGVALALALGTTFLVAAGKNKTVEADRFVLRDTAGHVRMDLNVSRGQPVLIMLDDHEKPRLVLGLDNQGPAISLADERGRERAVMRVYRDRSVFLFRGKNPRAGVELVAADLSGLTMFDANAKRRISLNLERPGGSLAFLDADGGRSAVFGAGELGPGMTLLRGDEPRVALLAAREGGMFEMTDKNGHVETHLSASDDGPAFRLLDAEGKSVFSKP